MPQQTFQDRQTFESIRLLLNGNATDAEERLPQSGTTAERPAHITGKIQVFYDTDIAKWVWSDGATWSNWTTAASVDEAGATMNTDTDVSGNGWVLDEDGMASDDNTKVPTQQSVKTYVDNATGIFSPSISTLQAGEVIAANDICYLDNATGKMFKATSSDPAKYYVAKNAAVLDEDIDFFTFGELEGINFESGQAYTIAAPLYVSTTEAGTLTHVDSGSGVVGYAMDDPDNWFLKM
jgi:hypothetical protein